MTLIIILLVLIAIGGLLGIIFIINYNKMQYLKTKIEQSENNINGALRDRFDAVCNASDIIKDVLKDNKDYLKDYTKLNKKEINNFDLDRKLTEAVRLVKTLINDNPVLEDNKGIDEVLKIFNSTEEILSASKTYFNKNTTELNNLIRKIPSNVVAKIINIKESNFYDSIENTKNNIKL